jgi:hypothetical protein
MVRKPFQCRDCGSVEGYRSRPRNVIEKYVLPVIGLQTVRCSDCFRRSYQPFFVLVRERPEPEASHHAAA